MAKKYIIGAILVIAVLAGGLLLIRSNNQQVVQSSKFQVAASFYPLYFFTSQIAGDKAHVINITPAEAEPHDYEPTAQDIVDIQNSQVLILNGNLEPWAANVVAGLDSKKTLIITAGENLTTQTVEEDGKNIIDPHIWLSPRLAEKMVDNIEAGLAKVDLADADYFAANASNLKIQLAQIDSEYMAGLKDCVQKNIVTSHIAFGYLAARYGLVQVSVSGLSPDAEPSAKQLGAIADFVKKNNIKYIFFESLVSPKLSETIANETGAKTLVLDPIEGLTPDEVSKGQNYITIMRSNLVNLQLALECK